MAAVDEEIDEDPDLATWCSDEPRSDPRKWAGRVAAAANAAEIAEESVNETANNSSAAQPLHRRLGVSTPRQLRTGGGSHRQSIEDQRHTLFTTFETPVLTRSKSLHGSDEDVIERQGRPPSMLEVIAVQQFVGDRC